MKTIAKLLVLVWIITGCNSEKGDEPQVKFRVVSASTKQPILNYVLEIKETMSPFSLAIDSIRSNVNGEIIVPEKYKSKYGNLKSSGYKELNGLLLSISPESKQYELEPLFWLKVYLKLNSDSIDTFLFHPWANWYNLNSPKVDTVFPPMPYSVFYMQPLYYTYSLKANPLIYFSRNVPITIIEHDTVSIKVEL